MNPFLLVAIKLLIGFAGLGIDYQHHRERQLGTVICQ